MKSIIDKKLSLELTNFYNEISDKNVSFTQHEYIGFWSRFDTLARLAPEDEYWGLYLIQAWISYRQGNYQDSLEALNKSFSLKEEEYIEGKNLERLIEAQRIKKLNFIKKFGRYPLLAFGFTCLLAVVFSGIFFLVFYLSAMGNLLYWLIIDKWGLGHKEVFAKVCIFLTIGFSILALNAWIHGALYEESPSSVQTNRVIRR